MSATVAAATYAGLRCRRNRVAVMIDYEILCKTIEDWKSGRRPSSIPRAPARQARQASEDFEAVDDADFEDADQRPADDRTIVYQMPEILDDEDL